MSVRLVLEIFETNMDMRALCYYETPTQYGIHECSSTCLHVGVGWIDGKIIGQVTSSTWVFWLLASKWSKLVAKQLNSTHNSDNNYINVNFFICRLYGTHIKIQRSSPVSWCFLLHWIHKVCRPKRVLRQFGRVQIIPPSPSRHLL